MNSLIALIQALQKITWGDIAGFVTAIGSTVTAVVAGYITVVSFIDKREKERDALKHQQELEQENLKHENVTKEYADLLAANEAQNQELRDHGAQLAAHTLAMENLEKAYKESLNTVTTNLDKVFSGYAVVFKENSDNKKRLENVQTILQKIKGDTFMVTSKKE